MEVDEVLQRIVRRHGFWFLAFILVLGALAVVARIAQPAEYAATARIIVKPDPPKSAAEAQAAADDALALVTSQTLVSQSLRSLGLRSDLQGRKAVGVALSPLGTSGVTELTVTYRNRAAATGLANSLAQGYVHLAEVSRQQRIQTVVDDLNTQIAAIDKRIADTERRILSTPPGNAADVLRERERSLVSQRATLTDERTHVTAGAALEDTPVVVDEAGAAVKSPTRAVQDGALGALIGLLMALLVATVIEIVSPSLVGRRAVARAAGIPVLGHLGHAPWRPGALDAEEMDEIAARAWLLAAAEKTDVLELAPIGDVPHIETLARRLNHLVLKLQPEATPEVAQAYSIYRPNGETTSPRPRLVIRAFGETPRAPVVWVTSTSVSVADLDRARDLLVIGHRRALGVITFRPSSRPAKKSELVIDAPVDDVLSVRQPVREA